ncbi:MAG: DUF805 domain-containing protein [Sporichthyaceae bacterium]
MNEYLAALRTYACFEGRADRRDYWMATLVHVAITVAIVVVWAIVGPGVFGLLYFAYAIGTFVPMLALTVRRLHDTDRSGWFMLLGVIPIVGGLVLLAFLVTDGTPGSNAHGEPQRVAFA